SDWQDQRAHGCLVRSLSRQPTIRAKTMRLSLAVCLSLLLTSISTAWAEPVLPLKKHDRIVLIGNTLAERMIYFNGLETEIYRRHPELDLVIRNLGWSADELTLRPRSKDFQDHGHRL